MFGSQYLTRLGQRLRALCSRATAEGQPTASPADSVARYRQLREAARRLNDRLISRLPEGAMLEAGRKLGLLKGNTFVLDSESEGAVLMDYTIFDMRRAGQTAVERCLAEFPPATGSDEMVVLKAMAEARYSIFLVEDVVRGVGVQLRDVFRDETLFLTDISMGSSARKGFALATRIISSEGIHMTTGASLPMDKHMGEKMIAAIQRTGFLKRVGSLTHLSPEQESELTALIIHACLAGGAASHIMYESADGHDETEDMPLEPPTARIPRNAPCPCGSGLKFKKCCGKRRRSEG